MNFRQKKMVEGTKDAEQNSPERISDPPLGHDSLPHVRHGRGGVPRLLPFRSV